LSFDKTPKLILVDTAWSEKRKWNANKYDISGGKSHSKFGLQWREVIHNTGVLFKIDKIPWNPSYKTSITDMWTFCHDKTGDLKFFSWSLGLKTGDFFSTFYVFIGSWFTVLCVF
jgi:hypothetical protein